MLNNVLGIISSALNAGWSWLNQLLAAVPGLFGFFMAVFTFVCVCRFFILPILGGAGLKSESRKEERKKK